jgi:hypothetical protein
MAKEANPWAGQLYLGLDLEALGLDIEARTEYGSTRCVVSPNTLTDGVPKVPKGCSEGFWHFWHLVTLRFSRNTRPQT